MVKVKEMQAYLAPEHVDSSQFIEQLASKNYLPSIELVKSAVEIASLYGSKQSTELGMSCLKQGLMTADILSDLEVDEPTIATAILFDSVNFAELSEDIVEEQCSVEVAKMLKGLLKMNGLSSIGSLSLYSTNKHQIDNIRKMLLAMVDDVRVVLIKLASILCMLRSLQPLPSTMQKEFATLAMNIYAPLANRLGIGAVKWEMEDLAFRYLEPEQYKDIARGLKSKRLERDKFVHDIVGTLNTKIRKLNINHFAVYGRAKHIHSIYRKMQRKQVPLEEIYDAIAVRILVDDKDACYEVLGLVHALWEQVVIEFDDYINNPKPNGYQSLHTAVKTNDNRVFEVQIRTYDMHNLAEMGVAAHWKYKEGVKNDLDSHERKIEWLREVLAWHRDMASTQGVSEIIETEFFEDRVYVFTPDGDVLDLPQGATPLDFAYHVHSQIGHRCRGSKVNGQIVPLTYVLKTGDRVEILTGNQPKPSRDWLNTHLKYLATSRAKAKVSHWFKLQDFDQHVIEGREILDKEMKTLNIKSEQIADVLPIFNLKKIDDLYAALARGDIKLGQVINRLSNQVDNHYEAEDTIVLKVPQLPKATDNDLKIEGVGNLLTHMARCCQPVPGDEVIGYITLGRGVSIHRKDCSNIIKASSQQQQRFLEVTFGDANLQKYIVDVLIKAYDRHSLLRDVTTLLSNEKVQVYSLQNKVDKKNNLSFINLTIEVDSLERLSLLLNKIQHIPNVLEANRKL